jgi:hypothetical protein
MTERLSLSTAYRFNRNNYTKGFYGLLPHISILTLTCESSDGLHHQYP